MMQAPIPPKKKDQKKKNKKSCEVEVGGEKEGGGLGNIGGSS